MADLFSNLTKGISSDTGAVQGDGGFKLINPASASGRASASSTPDPWSKEALASKVSGQLQAQQQQQLAGIGQTEAQAANRLVTKTPGSNPYGVIRQPWVFATFADLTNQDNIAQSLRNNQGIPPTAIVWYANPKSVDWTINQRGSEAKTKSGTVLHIWRDRLRRTDFDDPKITITFQTGSIIPGFDNALNPATLKGFPDQQIPPGLNDFYKYLQLVDASKIKNGQANLIHILYRSRIFPSMVMSGFFDPQSVVKFNDNADNPFQVNSWSASFTIYRTVPAYNSWSKLRDQFLAEFGSGDPFNRSLGTSTSSAGTPSSSGNNPFQTA